MHSGWQSSFEAFLAVTESEWLDVQKKHYPYATRGDSAPQNQIQAWIDSFRVLKSQIQRLVALKPEAIGWHCIFEYELPREGGRRPDLVILAGGSIVVVEFKQKSGVDPADIDQVAAYARDIAHYHDQSHDRNVVAILVPTSAVSAPSLISNVHILSPNDLADELVHIVPTSDGPAIDPEQWLQADYAPLPFLVDAARHIFTNDPLPYIKRAHAEAQIPCTLNYIETVVQQAQVNGERHLVLLTGAPGAGKTLVGLQFVHQFGNDEQGQKTAVFLSGNGPLVAVLQHALSSRVFVQDVHRFVKQYGMSRHERTPREHILVFDEAQRAWSREQVLEKQGIDASEPDIFVKIAERLPRWSVVVGLIGEGQEIHVGEEAGIDQWNDALHRGEKPWFVHAPPGIAQRFSAASTIHQTPFLNLSTSLRTHVAKDVQNWIAAVLDGKIQEAASLAHRIHREGFDMYVTQSFDDAKDYVRTRYEGHPLKRYGLLASSKPSRSIVDELGVPRDFQTTKRLKFGPWYNDPPDSPLSCCQLTSAVTEFGCQGLELDIPIVCWGEDLRWEDAGWVATLLPRKAQDPFQLRINAYRVLLSRGRDGIVIWVPPIQKMQQTYQTLKRSGAAELPTSGSMWMAAETRGPYHTS